jgi:LPXTG-motif cell wall-anchored protein
MKLRWLSTAATTFAIALLIMPPVATAVDLGTFTVGDVISMPKDCGGSGFAHVHVDDDDSLIEVDFFDIDPLTNPYLHPTATYGAGVFSVVIHCDAVATLHEATNVQFHYSFVVAAAAATTPTPTTVAAPGTTTTITTAVASLPTTGAATTSIALSGAAAVIIGAGLMMVRRRDPI